MTITKVTDGVYRGSQPVYVHCKAGVDRTGMVIATFRQANGMTRANAIREMKQMKMHWWYYFWAWFL